MTELNKLAVMLARAGIPFEIKAFNIDKMATWSIVYPCDALKKISAVSHQYSYGGRSGLIEILEIERNEAVGFLSAESAFEWFKDFNGGMENA